MQNIQAIFIQCESVIKTCAQFSTRVRRAISTNTSELQYTFSEACSIVAHEMNFVAMQTLRFWTSEGPDASWRSTLCVVTQYASSLRPLSAWGCFTLNLAARPSQFEYKAQHQSQHERSRKHVAPWKRFLNQGSGVRPAPPHSSAMLCNSHRSVLIERRWQAVALLRNDWNDSTWQVMHLSFCGFQSQAHTTASLGFWNAVKTK